MDDVSASLAQQDAYYRALEQAGANDREDVTSGGGHSRYDEGEDQ